MATVYKAYQPSIDRHVAIKILPGELAESKEFAGRFQQEARIIAKITSSAVRQKADHLCNDFRVLFSISVYVLSVWLG